MIMQIKQVTVKFTEEEFQILEALHLAYIKESGVFINRTEFIKLKLGVINQESNDVR